MSYDSIHALDGAVSGVEDSMWPPMVSYVWRAVNLVSTSPSAMQIVQVFILLVSAMYTLLYFTDRLWLSAVGLAVYVLIPVILGTIIVIWKDVLTAAFMLAGFAITLAFAKSNKRWVRWALSALALVFLFLGAATRHNSIVAVAPIVLLLSWYLLENISPRTWLRAGMAGMLAVALTGTLYQGKLLLDRYSLPDLAPIAGTEDFMPALRTLDLAGASLCANRNLFITSAPNMAVEQIREAYDPRHVNLSAGLFDLLEDESLVESDWETALKAEPWCFFSHQASTAIYLLGINSGEQFLITDPEIFTNDYGFVVIPSSLQTRLVNYVVNVSSVWFVRPWVFLLLSVVSLASIVVFRRRLSITTGQVLQLLTLQLAGLMYLAGLILLGNASDARLPFFSTTCFVIVSFVSLVKLCDLFVAHLRLKRTQYVIGGSNNE